MVRRVHHFDPSRLKIASKYIDLDYARKSVVLSATSELRRPLPGHVWYDAASEHEIERDFTSREIEFAPTVARFIERPLLTKEMVIFDEQKLYLDTSIEMDYETAQASSGVAARFGQAVAASSADPIDDRYGNETLLVSHHEGGNTWGHYVIQSLPRMMLFLDTFPEGKIGVPAWHAEGAPGFGEALSFYDIPPEKLAPIEPDKIYPLGRAVLLDFLFNFDEAAPHPWVLPALRRFVHQPPAAPGLRKAAFIKRRSDADRAIGNEAAVDAVIARREIEIYGPEELALHDQVDLWRSHELIIATLGSDLTNMVYARPGTKVLVLSPHWFGDAFFFSLSAAAGIHWYELRCGRKAAENALEEHRSSFDVDVDRLDAILNCLLI